MNQNSTLIHTDTSSQLPFYLDELGTEIKHWGNIIDLIQTKIHGIVSQVEKTLRGINKMIFLLF